jgi:hypothetical protein
VTGNARFRSFEESATVAGHNLWFETRLFEVLGAWVAAERDPEAKLAFGRHSFRHAGHAQLWRNRLPTVPEARWQAGVLTVPSDAGLAAFVDVLGETVGPDQTIERLVGAYRVAGPRLVSTYRDHLEEADPVNEGPTIRGLHLMAADELDAWRDGERLLERMLRSRADVDRAGAHQARLEALLVESGVIERA